VGYGYEYEVGIGDLLTFLKGKYVVEGLLRLILGFTIVEKDMKSLIRCKAKVVIKKEKFEHKKSNIYSWIERASCKARQACRPVVLVPLHDRELI
jgi:hypothetical protein